MTNALARETSPYLLQHAYNPVDWLPWSQQSLDLAKQQNKPILLSIGYSACHWCHVMAHESFENIETAELMNRYFINIKVDREERPDIDKIYQTAHQLIAQRSGGWPLTMFLSPHNQIPFFGGTYFPDSPRHGMISFNDLLQRIAEIYREEPDKIQQHIESMQQALVSLQLRDSGHQSVADIQCLEKFDSQLLALFDDQNGGFGQAPKFPQPAMMMQAIRRSFSLTPNDPLYRAMEFSLDKIALGGIRDHLAGGFYRYSVDDKWMIPHFEKMLYDNGQLLSVFAHMFQLTRKSDYQVAAESIVSWLSQEMQSESGAFFAALDADSEGVEGKFYSWIPEQVEALLDADFYPLFACKFGLDKPPNFEAQWHLHAYYSNQEIADRFDIDLDKFTGQLEESINILLDNRNRRIRPGLDNKILTAWNALVIQGLAISARLFSNAKYYQMAQNCLAVLRSKCWHNGRLLALSQHSGNRFSAYLDDYAQLLKATIDCLQYQWRSADLKFAITLADQLLELFQDTVHGGFYFTASDHESLIQRPRSWQDEAMPSGNAVASMAIYRLGMLLGNSQYILAAEKALQSVAGELNQNPLYGAGFISLMEDINSQPCTIIVRGEAPQLERWRDQLVLKLTPHQMAFFIPSSARNLPDAIAQKKTNNETTAWICHGFSCQPPITDLNSLISTISSLRD